MNTEKIKKGTEKIEKDEGRMDLSLYMAEVIEELKEDKKHPAVHTYTSTLHSFAAFSGGAMPVNEVFTPGRLKEYEQWLLQRRLSWNTISTYMRTLQAVYNRLSPPGTPEHNPKLFDDVYTKVKSQTKRALTEEQMAQLIYADSGTFPERLRRTQAYFQLMFLFRGMPFIDLAYLRKIDVQGNRIVYRRHKTGKQMTVCIPREALPLLKEFKDKNEASLYLFPILNTETKGDYALYKCYQKALRNFNKMLRLLARDLLPGIKISSYTARHTWATLAYHMKMPIGIISQALGHSSIRVTETYLKPFENERVDKENRKLISSVRKSRWKKNVTYNIL
ncbi:tyrosine-type recombinase/integrase [Bacteroides timonensis]|uniref:tyrosine-type recombinase/integrase n=1 Tax=Bacteroides timonensis TaxID=1470345 RepID=UPI0004BBAF7E|nr:tyrosine-type recombinase/integrase [Bacteroides timonensis]